MNYNIQNPFFQAYWSKTTKILCAPNALSQFCYYEGLNVFCTTSRHLHITLYYDSVHIALLSNLAVNNQPKKKTSNPRLE